MFVYLHMYWMSHGQHKMISMQKFTYHQTNKKALEIYGNCIDPILVTKRIGFQTFFNSRSFVNVKQNNKEITKFLALTFISQDIHKCNLLTLIISQTIHTIFTIFITNISVGLPKSVIVSVPYIFAGGWREGSFHDYSLDIARSPLIGASDHPSFWGTIVE